MEIKEMNIFEKLLNITNELGVIEKNLQIEVTKSRSYKAVSERDILDAVKPLEQKYRVYSYPMTRQVIDKDILVSESEYGKKNTLFMRIETQYVFVNIDKPEEKIIVTTHGDGLDTGDKAPGKAMTYADKYALMKAYKISTGDDPDKEASPENYTTKITKQMEKALRQAIQNKNIDNDKVIEKLKELGHTKLEELELVELMNFKKDIGV